MISKNRKSGPWLLALFGLLVLPAVCLAADSEEGLVGYWKFDEGQGNICKDSSGHGNHGKIFGNPTWEKGNYALDAFGTPIMGKDAAGGALKFDGVDDYVNCGRGASLDIAGPLTLEVWIHPLAKPSAEPGIAGKHLDIYALTYYRPTNSFWYISSGGNKCGASINVGEWSHLAGVFDGEMMRLYLNGKAVGLRKSNFKSVNRGKDFLIGCLAFDPDTKDLSDPEIPHFNGLIDELKVYNRALTEKEIVLQYNAQAHEKSRTRLDPAWFDDLKVASYYYSDLNKLVVEMDYRGLLPLPPEAAIDVLLLRDGETAKPQRRKSIKDLSKNGMIETSFSLEDLPEGDYIAQAILKKGNVSGATAKTAFVHPQSPVSVVSPREKIAPALPPKRELTPYTMELCDGGAFRIKFMGKDYLIESAYSYPHGGENKLGASAEPNKTAEKSWTVETNKIADGQFSVSAHGSFYSIERTIEKQPSRIYIKDTIKNISSQDIGIILRNEFDGRGKSITESYLGGWKEKGRRIDSFSPTVFLSDKKVGLGIVPLDDIYTVQSSLYYEKGFAGIADNEFALAKGASYTLEWAVYPNDTGDYYDFINTVRHDEDCPTSGKMGICAKGGVGVL